MLKMEQDSDTGAIALCALRYCVGRRTYMPELVVSWIKKYWDTFSVSDKKVMLRSLTSDIKSGVDLGHDCDRLTWHDFHAWMQQKIQ